MPKTYELQCGCSLVHVLKSIRLCIWGLGTISKTLATDDQLWQLTLSSTSLLLLHFNVASSGMRWVPTFPLLALHVNVKFAVPEWKKMLNFGYDQWSNMLTVSEEIFHYLLQDENHYVFWNGYCFTHLQIFRSRLLSFAEVILIYICWLFINLPSRSVWFVCLQV